MIQYYLELISRPKYMLSEAESMFIEAFPFLLVGAVVLIILLIGTVGEIICEKHRRNKKRKDRKK